MKNKSIVLTSVALMLLMMIPAGAFQVHAAVTNPGVLIAERIGEPMFADPVYQYDTASLEMLMNIYEPLIFFNGTSVSSFIGIIADSWYGKIISVTDPMTGQIYTQKWVFHIRPNVHFQYYDGSVVGENDTVTPADVEYSFERNMVVDSSLGGELLIWGALGFAGAAWNGADDPLFGKRIDFAVQSNASDVTFYLTAPFEPFLQIVAQMYGAIFSKAWSIPSSGIDGHDANWDGVWPIWANDPESGNDNPQNYTRYTKYHDMTTSPLEVVDPSSPGPHLDYILGTGPYMFNYWNKGDGGQYSLIKNPTYWGGWSGSHVNEYISKYISDWPTRRDDFLAGACDICDIPRQYMTQVLGQPGIRCMKGLPTLDCVGMFLCGNISSTSPYIGIIPPDGEFNGIGFPENGFQDAKLRKAFRHLFPYDRYIADQYLGEAIQPATCIVPGLAYYDQSIPKPQYNRTLAIQLLKEAWGGSEESPGPVWTNGFTMSFVSVASSHYEPWPFMLKEEFDYINTNYGTHFNVTVTEVTLNNYITLWKSKKLPFFLAGWMVDYPDAHDFVVPFMDCISGDFAKYQGFHNDTIIEWIRNGIGTIIPSERQYWYSLLQEAFIDNCYSFTYLQPTGRRWEGDWVQGWFFNSIYSLFMTYAYYLWKADPSTVPRIISSSIHINSYATGPAGDVIFDAHDKSNHTWELANETIEVELHDLSGTHAPTVSILSALSSSYSMSYNSVTKMWVVHVQDLVWLQYCVPTDIVKIHVYNLIAMTYANESVEITTDWNSSDAIVNTAPDKFVSVSHKVGDLGSGAPVAQFGVFDGLVDASDVNLFIRCLRGTAPAQYMYLGDLGSGAPVAHFFQFDGLVDASDVNLFIRCLRGQGP